MEATTILQNNQVTSLANDIMAKISIIINQKVVDEKIKLTEEHDIFASDLLDDFNYLIKLKEDAVECIKYYNEYVDTFDEQLIPKYTRYLSVGYDLNEDNYLSNVSHVFYKKYNLTPEHINFLIKGTIRNKVLAVLSTMYNDSYENIVSAVLEKVNIDDLFDNRQMYINN